MKEERKKGRKERRKEGRKQRSKWCYKVVMVAVSCIPERRKVLIKRW